MFNLTQYLFVLENRTMTRAFVFCHFVLSMMTSYFVSAKNNLFSVHGAIFDLTCSGTNVLFTELHFSKIKCTLLCENNNLCSGFTFRTSDGNCVGCKGGHGHLVSSELGMKYYIPQSHKWGAACTSNDVCVGENTDCFDGMCVCTPGYSFQAATRSCHAGCKTYGDTFQKYKGYIISYNNYKVFSDITLESCLQKCRDLSVCVSIDYLPIYVDGKRRCNLQVVTALEVPQSFSSSSENDEYHNRNCH